MDTSALSDLLTAPKPRNALKRVSEGLYRSQSSGVYVAHFRLNGRVIKESLDTTELVVAKRKLRDLRTERENLKPKVGKQTLRELSSGT